MRLYHYLEPKWALDDIRRGRLKLSRNDDMNDPFEWKSVFLEHEPSRVKMARTLATEGARVACFSRSRDNILLWSHYAEKHKGICLGFEVPDEYAKEITYHEDVWIVPNPVEEHSAEARAILERLYWGKYMGWKYKREFRLTHTSDVLDEEIGQYFAPFSDNLRLKEVITGVKFKLTRRPIDEALKNYDGDVEVLKASQNDKAFEIIISEHGS